MDRLKYYGKGHENLGVQFQADLVYVSGSLGIQVSQRIELEHVYTLLNLIQRFSTKVK
jgi:hypothetical protein